eukprot:2934584-Rhodomonas_salina.3
MCADEQYWKFRYCEVRRGKLEIQLFRISTLLSRPGRVQVQLSNLKSATASAEVVDAVGELQKSSSFWPGLSFHALLRRS